MIITGKKFSKPEMSRVKNGDIVLPGQKTEKRERLDLLLKARFPEYKRGTLQNFIKSGYVTVNGSVVKKPNAEIVTENAEGEALEPELTLRVPERKPAPEAEVIYEDDNVLVINKPAGLLSMAKGEWTAEPTLEDYGLLVHRLDRDTSGVVILAKNEATQKSLRKQFQERRTHKTYFAVTSGVPKLPAAEINLPIARNLKRPTTFMVDPKGKPAVTYYTVLTTSTTGKRSLIELKPVSGRTHQLRVHLKYLGCPILGDRVYGKEEATRLFLHAGQLEITIPGEDGGERVSFTAPLPPEFEKEVA